jgi:drug/metabolite transporter (DMT)-like permease
MVFARSIIQTVFALIGCAIYKTNPLGAPPVRKWLLVRGVFGTASLCFFYYSISNLPLADANGKVYLFFFFSDKDRTNTYSVVLFFLGPAMTAILAALLLGESFTPFDALCSATCVLGVILVAKPEFLFGSGQSVPNIDETHRMIAIMCACTGALMSSIAYITVRKMGKGASFMVVVFSFGFIASIISGIGMTTIQTFVWPKGFTQWSILLWVGIFAFVGQCLMVKG